MRLLSGLLFAFVTAAALGLGATWLATTRSIAFGAVTLGAWSAWPKSGTLEVDPYTRAVLARSGALPLGSGDGIEFIARTDDGGRALDGHCDVIVSGSTPPARYWTLTLSDAAGQLAANALGRHGFTSQEITWRSDGTFVITAAAQARPGNWLPTGGASRYILALRLYDTPVGVATRAARETTMPSVTLGICG